MPHPAHVVDPETRTWMQVLDFGEQSWRMGVGMWNSGTGMEGKPNQRGGWIIKLITTAGNWGVLSRNHSKKRGRMDLMTVCLRNIRLEDLSRLPSPLVNGT